MAFLFPAFIYSNFKEIFTTVTSYAGNLNVSPSGEKIVFDTFEDGNSDIILSNLDGTGLINLTQASDDSEINPTWSPTGDLISFLDKDKYLAIAPHIAKSFTVPFIANS